MVLTNAIREVGAVLGIAVLATVLSRSGGYVTPSVFAQALVPAVLVGAGVVALGPLSALFMPRLQVLALTCPARRIDEVTLRGSAERGPPRWLRFLSGA